MSGKRDSKLVQARVGVTFYLHPQPLKGAMRVTGSRYTKKIAQSKAALHYIYRAVSGTRTRDPRLGKPMLYQLSYYRIYGRTKLQKI